MVYLFIQNIFFNQIYLCIFILARRVELATLETIDLIEGFSLNVFHVFKNNAPYKIIKLIIHNKNIYPLHPFIILIIKYKIIIMIPSFSMKPHCTVNILIMHISLGGTR